jgi:hypothetical protein
MSPQKAKWNKLYEEQKASFGERVPCADSGCMEPRHNAEPHHPMNRHGEMLLCWVWVTKSMHERIHRFGTQSRALKWLLASYDGKPYDSMELRAWAPHYEAHWPEKFKRVRHHS